MTYTVVAFDPRSQAMALGTVSHSSSVLAKVLTRSGARGQEVLVASQAFSSPALGEAAARHALEGGDPRELPAICRASPGGAFRQVVSVSYRGALGGYTGSACLDFAGHIVDVEARVALAGNMLLDEGVLQAAYAGYQDSRGGLDIRVVAALRAAGESGGDVRGDRSAGLVVLRPEGVIDVRVDDQEEPLRELERLRDQAAERAVLGACFAWLAGGRPPALLPTLVDRLADGADKDDDVAAWLGVVSELGGLRRPDISVAGARLAEVLLDRIRAGQRTQVRQEGYCDVG